ncbi:MAG: MBL fold metallo-hydrolase [Bdellovibrionales bacterium RBG_16_40_8]|nr:MAG: MBL fold metallo-hydrolase [Bdellovibrionales bacterium RBG_16_40_8]
MKIKLWGIRGSLPTPLTPLQVYNRVFDLLDKYDKARETSKLTPADFLKSLPEHETFGYGGHTSCVEVFDANTRLIIDGGSGIRLLGNEIMMESTSLGRAQIHILMTHFHWDHLIGLPFFTPIFLPGNEIHFYGVQDNLEENIRRVFTKPNFPMAFEQLPSKIIFHKLAPRTPVKFGKFSVTPYKLDHPDPCWGYRFEHSNKVFSHCVDSECTRVSREQMGPDLPLYQNVDLMTFDAQYSFMEASERINWGHSSGPTGIDIAMREKVKQVLFIHHDPASSDAKISRAEQQTRIYYESVLESASNQGLAHGLRWCFAHEGMVLQP